MSSELNDKSFIPNYIAIHHQNNNENNPFLKTILQRKLAVLTLAHSSKSLENAPACHIFEDQLHDYVKLIDDRSGINNFGKATLELMSNVKNLSKSWKSDLPTTLDDISNPWKSFKGECLNFSDTYGCQNEYPSPSLVPDLLGPSQLPNRQKYLIKSTVNSVSSGSSTSTSAQPAERRPLYPVFENQHSKVRSFGTAESDNCSISNASKLSKEPRSNNYSLIPNNLRNTLPSLPDVQPRSFTHKKKSLYSSYADKNEEEAESSGIYNKFPGGKGYGRSRKPLFSDLGIGNRSEYDEETQKAEYQNHFMTAGQELKLSNQRKNSNVNSRTSDYDRGFRGCERNPGFQPMAGIKKSLGGKRAVSSKFVPPIRNNSQEEAYNFGGNPEPERDPESEVDERLKHIEPKMVELIQNEIMDCGSKIGWEDIAGLEFAKNTIQEIVVWPMLRPDIFTGLRRPPKGILLFGPPGTGKTLIGKCIASQSNSTFFSISASSLTSKWIGDGEKMVRALFAVARVHQPAVVFIDEIDSLLSQRSDTEHESSRRIKTEFLVQLDGAATGEEDRILVIGATNRPQELDEAARRRLVKRLYIPLPDTEARKQLVQNLMKTERNDLSIDDVIEIATLTDGYSGADMKNLCQEACLGPIRSISSKDMFQISAEQVRPVSISDFKSALRRVKSSVSSQDLEQYTKWDLQFGSGSV